MTPPRSDSFARGSGLALLFSPRARPRQTGLRGSLACGLVVLLSLVATLAAKAADRIAIAFDLPADRAERSLKQFARVAGVEVVFSAELATGVLTNAVRGQLRPIDAAHQLLAGTILDATQKNPGAAIVITRRAHLPAPPKPAPPGAPNAPRTPLSFNAEPKPMKSRLVTLLTGWLAATAAPTTQAQAPAATATAVTGEKTIALTPFEVVADREFGYKASNSVTASRFALPILDTPMSITVVTEEFMRDIGSRDALSSLAYVSGITEGGGSSIRLEGSNSFNVRGATTPFILRDGVKFYGLSDSYNIERWEVLKGIVGTMYGEKNLGGVVNSVTKRPRDKSAHELFVRTDEYGSWRFQGDFTGPLNAQRTVLYRLMLLDKNEKTSMDDERLKARGITGVLTFLPFRGTKLDVSAEFYDQDNTLATKLPPMANANGPRFFGDTEWQVRPTHAPVSRTFNYGGKDSFLDERDRLLTATLDQRLASWLNFRSYASYATRDQERLNRDAGQTLKELVPGTTLRYFDFGTASMVTLNASDPRAQQLAQTVQSANSNLRENDNQDFIWRNDLLAEYRFLGAKHRTLLGYEVQERGGDSKNWGAYSAFTLDSRNPYAAALRANQSGANAPGIVALDLLAIPGLNLPSPTVAEIKNERNINPSFFTGGGGRVEHVRAFYGVHYAQFFRDRMTVMAGLRQDRFRSTPSWSYTTNFASRVYNYVQPNWQVYNSPQVGVSFRLRKDLSVYASWSDVLLALNSGGGGTPFVDELVNTNGTWSGGPAKAKDPQTGTHREIGLKTEFFDGRLSGTVAAFETFKENVPYTVLRIDPANITNGQLDYRTLAGEERYTGVELDATYAILKPWSAVFSYAYTDAKVTKDSALFTPQDIDPNTPGNQAGTPVKNLEGAQVANVPRHQVRLWNSYRFTAAQGWLKSVGLGAGIRYRTEANIQSAFNTRGKYPAYTVVDLSVSRRFAVAGREVSALLRCNNVFDKEYYGTRQIYGEPREFVLEARTRF